MGPATPPVFTIMFCMGLASFSSFTTTTPIKTSEWPHKYLVAEWKTMSQPMSSGCCR